MNLFNNCTRGLKFALVRNFKIFTATCWHPDQTLQWSSSMLCHQNLPRPLAVHLPQQDQPR